MMIFNGKQLIINWEPEEVKNVTARRQLIQNKNIILYVDAILQSNERTRK